MNKKKRLMNCKGSISYYITYLMLAFGVLFIGAILTPMALNFNLAIWDSAEEILADAEEITENFSNEEVKTAVQASLGAAQDSFITSVDIMAIFIQFLPFIVIVVILMIVFIQVRQQVESDVV